MVNGKIKQKTCKQTVTQPIFVPFVKTKRAKI